jgi:hypothetical protein
VKTSHGHIMLQPRPAGAPVRSSPRTHAAISPRTPGLVSKSASTKTSTRRSARCAAAQGRILAQDSWLRVRILTEGRRNSRWSGVSGWLHLACLDGTTTGGRKASRWFPWRRSGLRRRPGQTDPSWLCPVSGRHHGHGVARDAGDATGHRSTAADGGRVWAIVPGLRQPARPDPGGQGAAGAPRQAGVRAPAAARGQAAGNHGRRPTARGARVVSAAWETRCCRLSAWPRS